jgi:LmbE family N-acetylglucosaminyl deacetylase
MNNTVVVVAAHPDDEVLGCGGTIARLCQEGRAVHVLLMADGETSREMAPGQDAGDKSVSMRNQAAIVASKILGCSSIKLLNLPDNRMDGLELLDVVKEIESFVNRYQPQTVMSHHASDVNIDHRVIHDAVVTACRAQPGFPVKELRFFEVPSSTEWRPPGGIEPFCPNLFVDISSTLEVKLRALEAYESELRPFPHPRSLKAVEALALWRGATVGVCAAEAFVLGRMLV